MSDENVFRGDIPGRSAARGRIGVKGDPGTTGTWNPSQRNQAPGREGTKPPGEVASKPEDAEAILRATYGMGSAELIAGITSGRLGGSLLKDGGKIVGIEKDGRKYLFGSPENTGTITPAARPDSVPTDGLPRTPGFAAGIGGNATQPAGGTRHSPAGGPSDRGQYPKGSRQP